MKKLLLLSLLSFAGLNQAQNLLNGLQACYPLDGNANNSAATGSALNGTLVNVTPSNGHTNVSNTSYALSGSTSSYIKLPDHPGLKSDSVFFSGWFYLSSLPYEQYLVYTKNSCSFNFEAYSLITYDNPSLGHQVFRLDKVDNTCIYPNHIEATTIPSAGNWYHLCFFVGLTSMKLYVNGVLEASAVINTSFDYTSGKEVFLGVTNESNFDWPFNGRIDNVRFYNRELTAAEVLILYNTDPPCSETTPGTAPTASFTASKKQICKGQSIAFTNLSTNNPTSYSWSFPGGSPLTSTLSNPSVYYANSGVYVVSLIATNAFGSSTTYTSSITVSGCTSISENEYGEFNFYPNPSSGKITLNNIGSATFKIYDLTGKLIPYTSHKLADHSVELDLSENAEGIYFISLISEEGSVLKSLKIILEK